MWYNPLKVSGKEEVMTTGVGRIELVYVRPGHIKNGDRNYVSRHPLALALQEMHPGTTWWVCANYAMRKGALTIEEMWEISEEGRAFVKDFNAGQAVEPISIRITKTDK